MLSHAVRGESSFDHSVLLCLQYSAFDGVSVEQTVTRL